MGHKCILELILMSVYNLIYILNKHEKNILSIVAYTNHDRLHDLHTQTNNRCIIHLYCQMIINKQYMQKNRNALFCNFRQNLSMDQASNHHYPQYKEDNTLSIHYNLSIYNNSYHHNSYRHFVSDKVNGYRPHHSTKNIK